MAQQAQQTFHAILDNGDRMFVTKGEVLPDGHELVRRDDGSGVLFKRLDLGEEAPKSESKAPPKQAAREPSQRQKGS